MTVNGLIQFNLGMISGRSTIFTSRGIRKKKENMKPLNKSSKKWEYGKQMSAKSVMLGFLLVFLIIVICSGIATFVSRPNDLVPPGPEPYYGITYFVGLIAALFVPSLAELSRKHS